MTTGLIHVIESDGSEWYEKAGVDARIAEMEAENEALVETQRRRVVLLLGDREKAGRDLKQAEAALAERDRMLRMAGEEGDFPCTYCRGMTQHDPTCPLLVIRRTADLQACGKGW